jgi:O-antigen ligase
MESSFTETIKQLGMVDILLLAGFASIIFYFMLARQTSYLIFSLVLSCSLVGTTIPLLGHIAPLIRWLAIFSLFLLGIYQGRIRPSPGILFFWGYAILGFVFLYGATTIGYQFQRSIMLLVVGITVPLIYSNKSFQYYQFSTTCIAVAAAIFCLLNFSDFPILLTSTNRFSGFSRGAATFSLYLGALLPFTLWGFWKSKGWVRFLCLAGFIAGTMMLFFSGQRSGTIAGLVGLIPLFLMIQNRKTVGWSILLVCLLFLLGFGFYQLTNSDRITFLLNRYMLDAGLSGRDQIWNIVLTEIQKNPIVGRGTGAAEMLISASFHNAYLEVWYNTGFLGLLFFIAAQLYFLYRAVFLFYTVRDPNVKSLAVLALGYMLGFILISLFESIGAGSSSLNLILYLLLGLFLSSDPVAIPEISKEPLIAQKVSYHPIH